MRFPSRLSLIGFSRAVRGHGQPEATGGIDPKIPAAAELQRHKACRKTPLPPPETGDFPPAKSPQETGAPKVVQNVSSIVHYRKKPALSQG